MCAAFETVLGLGLAWCVPLTSKVLAYCMLSWRMEAVLAVAIALISK